MSLGQHGTQRRYLHGCRCDECRSAHSEAARDYRGRCANGLAGLQVVDVPPGVEPGGTGPVESGVQVELRGLAEAEARPGLVAAALALARTLDDARAAPYWPATAKVLVTILERMHTGGDARRPRLAAVRALTKPSARG